MTTLRTTTPKGWKQINLERECSFERGMETGADAYNTEGIGDRFIRVVDVTGSRDTPMFVYGIHTTKRVKREDILLTLDGTVGAVIRGLEGIYSTGVRKVSFRDAQHSSRLLYYILQSANVQRTIDLYASGSTIKHASAAISHLIAAVPEALKEQDKIADVLELIDQAIDKTDALIKKYERMRTGMMQDLFRYGIDEKGQVRSEKTHKFKNSRLGKIPQDWELSELKVISKISDGTHQSVSFVEEGIPFLFVSCVRDGEVKWDLTEKVSQQIYSVISKGKEPRAGMILYTVVGSYGHAALITDDKSFAFQRHIAYMFPNHSKISSQYLSYWLNGDVAKTYAEVVALGNAQKTITLGDLGTFPVILPKKDEQERISAALSHISNLISIEKNYRAKLTRQKSGLMSDLLTGTVRTIET